MITTKYNINLPLKKSLRIAVAADIHSTAKYKDIADTIDRTMPDAVLIPGDLCHAADSYEIPLRFLELVTSIAPVYYTFGNHERDTDESLFNIDGVHLVNDSFEQFGDVLIGGLRSGFQGQKETNFSRTPEPNIAFLDEFENESGVKILMCHHPEYYPRYLEGRSFDLILSGHAHGGQWRFFGRGLFAPGQGFFPKYTSGMYGNMIVSRGLSNNVFVPRLFNKPELIVLDIAPLS